MKRLRSLTILASILLLFAVGCGSSETSNGNEEEDPTQTEDTTGNGEDDADEMSDEDTTGDNGETEEDDDNGDSGPKGCDASNPPSRCSADPASFDWKPSSVISSLSITDGSVTIDGTSYDNSIGSQLSQFGRLQSVNDNIASAIAAGDLIVLFEHDGVTALDASTTFNMNVWVGAFDGINSIPGSPSDGNTFTVLDQTVDEGAQPEAYISDAELTSEGNVFGGPGAVPLSFEIFGVTIGATIEDAEIGGTVDAQQSALDGTGVYISDGTIAGNIPLKDVYDSINSFVGSNCSCIEGLSGDLIQYQESDISSASCQTAGSDFTNNCGEETDVETACGAIAGACGVVSQVVSPDKDTDNDGVNDAISVGANFSASGAEITGVSTMSSGGGS